MYPLKMLNNAELFFPRPLNQKSKLGSIMGFSQSVLKGDAGFSQLACFLPVCSLHLISLSATVSLWGK